MAFRNQPKDGWIEEAKKDIPRILRGFWERRIKSEDPKFNRERFKGFIKSTYHAAGNEWTASVDKEFEIIIREKNDFERFRRFFGDWFTIFSAMVVDRNHIIQPQEKVTDIKDDDLLGVSEFLDATKVSAAITLGNAQSEFKTVLSPNIPSSAPFQIHSVTKMFTGVLVLKMVENNFLPEEELNKPLKEAFDGEFLKSLPKEFKERFGSHLAEVSLFQLMTHNGGLGDYYESENKAVEMQNSHSYQKAILDALSKNPAHPDVPKIVQISDLLQYAEDKTYPVGEYHYSNVGMVLVGLAVEYAYKRKSPEKTVTADFESLLQEFVLKEAKIEPKNFSKTMPPEGRFNKDKQADPAAPFITASPAGHHWTTVEDLARFGVYFYKEYTTNSRFHSLVERYGKEFHPEEGVFSHSGTLTGASSAFLSISKKGNIIAVACDNSDENANALEFRLKQKIFSEPAQHSKDARKEDMAMSSTGRPSDKENKITKLSKFASISVEDIPQDDANRKIYFYYVAPPPSKEVEKLLLVIFPTKGFPKEIELKYSPDAQKWMAEFESPADALDSFQISLNVGLSDPLEKRQRAAFLEQGSLIMTKGKPDPWIYEHHDVPKGDLKKMLLKNDGSLSDSIPTSESELSPGDRIVTLYFPPGFNNDDKQKPYNLQVTLDGRQYLDVMHMNTVFDNLLAAQKIEPTVIVFISPHSGPPDAKKEGFGEVMPKGYSNSMRLKEYCCNPEFADKLAALPATLRQQFNVTNKSENTTIWGVSAGGLQAEYTALLHPEVFGNVVAQSPMAWNIPVKNGEDWRKGITDTKDSNGFDITWTTATAELPEKETAHNEYITEALRKGHDSISDRDIAPSHPLRFYFDAGEKEKEYSAKEGSANLVKSTELFATALIEKGHAVINHSPTHHGVHILPGGHTLLTWMSNLANAAKAVNPPRFTMTDEIVSSVSKNTSEQKEMGGSTTKIFQGAEMKTSEIGKEKPTVEPAPVTVVVSSGSPASTPVKSDTQVSIPTFSRRKSSTD